MVLWDYEENPETKYRDRCRSWSIGIRNILDNIISSRGKETTTEDKNSSPLVENE